MFDLPIDDSFQDIDQIEVSISGQPEKKGGGGVGDSSGHLNQFDSMTAAETAFDGRCKYNLMSQEYEVKHLTSGLWQTVKRDAMSRVYRQLIAKYGRGVHKDVVTDTIKDLCHENEYHPLETYLNHVAENVEPDWDGFHHLITNAFGPKTDSPFADEIMQGFMVAAVARVFHPGTYYRFMPVLMGEKQIGKTFMKHLAPKFNGLSTGTTVQGRAHAPVSMDQLVYAGRRSLIIEASEVNQLFNAKQTDLEAVKTYISADQLEAEFKGTNNESVTISWVTYGTTNARVFMKEELVGRVLPIDLFHLEPREFVAGMDFFERRDGIWSAAVHYWRENYRPGEAIDYPDEVVDAVSEIAHENASNHPWQKILDQRLNFSDRLFLTSAEVAASIKRANGDNYASDASITGFMNHRNWVYRKGRFDMENSERIIYRWVNEPKVKRAGSIRKALELDEAARSFTKLQVDEDAPEDLAEE